MSPFWQAILVQLFGAKLTANKQKLQFLRIFLMYIKIITSMMNEWLFKGSVTNRFCPREQKRHMDVLLETPPPPWKRHALFSCTYNQSYGSFSIISTNLALFRPFFGRGFPREFPSQSYGKLKGFRGILETSAEERGIRKSGNWKIFTSADISVYQYGKNVLYFFYNIAQRTLTEEWRAIFRVGVELYQYGS